MDWQEMILFLVFYYDLIITGFSSDNGSKTTEQMKQQSTFTDWDFVNIWNMDEGVTYLYSIGMQRFYPGADDPADNYIIPLAWPTTSNQKTLRFGQIDNFYNAIHTGIDIQGNTGSNIVSALNGQVVYTGYNWDYGNIVYINADYYGKKIQTRYAHLQDYSVTTGLLVNAKPTNEQIESLRQLIKILYSIYGIDYVGGHKDFALPQHPTNCPGNIAYPILQNEAIIN